MSNKFTVYWTDTVSKSVPIEASSKEEALEKFKNGDYNTREVMEENVDCTQTDEELLEDME